VQTDFCKLVKLLDLHKHFCTLKTEHWQNRESINGVLMVRQLNEWVYV
jgi:hypothetical protein